MKKIITIIIASTIFTFLVSLIRFIWQINHFSHLSKPVDAVLILGTKTYINGNINQCLIARLDHGIQLIQNDLAKFLILSGGRDRLNQPTQAQIMASLARAKGIDPTIIWTENRSRDTWENILYTQKIIQENNWHTIALVTEPYHLKRALMIAKALNLQAYPSPVTTSPCWQNPQLKYLLILRDFLAFWQDYWRIFNAK